MNRASLVFQFENVHTQYSMHIPPSCRHLCVIPQLLNYDTDFTLISIFTKSGKTVIAKIQPLRNVHQDEIAIIVWASQKQPFLGNVWRQTNFETSSHAATL